MSKQLRKALTDELHRRHGYKVMEAKIKPVHIANALMRSEHQCVGRMTVLEQLFVAVIGYQVVFVDDQGFAADSHSIGY